MPGTPRPDWQSQRGALRALIFDDAYRRAWFAAGERDRFYRPTDPHQVERTAARVAADVTTRRRRGAAPILDIYPRTLAGVAGAELGRLLALFCRSQWFAGHGERPDRADQLSIEEAFYRFLCDERIGDPEVRLAELADAIICALAVQPRPAFRVPDEVERAPFGPFAIVHVHDRTLLFAAVGQRVVRGPIDAVTAATLHHRGVRPADIDIPPAAWQSAVSSLAALGLTLDG